MKERNTVVRYVVRLLVVGLFLSPKALILGDIHQEDASIIIEHAPSINGVVEGNIRFNRGESLNLNSGGEVLGVLSVPGNPNIRINGNGSVGEILEGGGSGSPSGYRIHINGGANVNTILVHSDPIALAPPVSPIAPSGYRSVSINASNDDPGDFSTIRNMNINAGGVVLDVPPGAYGNFSLNNGSELVLGEEGAAEAMRYSFERLQLNGRSKVSVVGKVIIDLGNGFSTSGSIGSEEHVEWLLVNVAQGGVNLNSDGRFYGALKAPRGHVNINSNARLEGSLEADRLNLNSNGMIVASLGLNPDENQPPVAYDDSIYLLEDDSISIELNADDADGDAIVFTVEGSPANGVLSGIAPHLTYTPLPDFFGEDKLLFSVNDGKEESNIGTVSLIIEPINDAPVAVSQTVETLEDVALDLILEGQDKETAGLVYQIEEFPSFGTLDTSDLPHIRYVPNQDSNEDDAFTFTVFDGEAYSDLGTVSITVNPVNDAPGAVPLEFEMLEDEELELALEGVDVEGSQLEYEILSSPSHGELYLIVPQNPVLTPDYRYRPDLDWFGVEGFTYRVFDGLEWSEEVLVSIDVEPVNDAPTVVDGEMETLEDVLLSGQLTGSDVDSSSISFALDGPPTRGEVVISEDGSFQYTPIENENGQDTFSFYATDGDLNSISGTIVVTIDPVNDSPEAISQSIQVSEDIPQSLVIIASDVEEDSLTFAITNPPAHGRLSGEIPYLVYTPDENYSDPEGDSFSFIANDGELDSNTATIFISIDPVNDAPEADGFSFMVDEDRMYSGVLSGSDVDGDALRFITNSEPIHGSVVLEADGGFVYTPNANYEGGDAFTFAVFDGDLESLAANVSITVLGINDAPEVSPFSFELDEDSFVSFVLEGEDLEGDSLIFEVLREPEFGVRTGVSPEITYIPDPNFFGEDYMEYRAFDGEDYSEIERIDFEVFPVNDYPVAQALSLTVEEDEQVSFTVRAGDIEDLDLSYELTVDPGNGVVVGDLPNGIYIPDPDFSGTDSFTVKVVDLEGGWVELPVTVTVLAKNDAPTANSFSIEVVGNGSVSLPLSGQDSDSGDLVFLIEIEPVNGSISTDGSGAFVYTPATNFSGTDLIGYVAFDGELKSQIVMVSITVTVPENTAPIVDAGPDVSETFTVVASQNLILNPSAEAPLELGELPHWVEVAGSSWGARTGEGLYPSAKDGSLYFHANGGDISEIYQDVDLSDYVGSIDLGLLTLDFSGYTRSKTDVRLDQPEVVLEFRDDANLSSIQSYQIRPEPQSDRWVLAARSAKAPIGARWVRVRLLSEKAVGDTENSAYFDQLSLKAITYPVVELNGEVTDDGLPFGSELSVEWSGPNIEGSYSIIESGSANTFVEFTAPGVFVFTLSASDGELSSSDSVQVSVVESDSNQPPLVDAGEAQTVFLPEATAYLEGSVSDVTLPNGALSVYWTIVEGGLDAVFEDPTSVSTSIRFRRSGTYVLSLSADDGELIGQDEITIYVDCPSEPVPLDFALAIDHSGSMGGGPGSKLDAALLASEEFIRNINPWTDRVSLFTFDSVVPEVALTNDQDLLLASVRNMSGGSSDFGRGIQFAQDHFDLEARNDAERIIVIVADGQTPSGPVITAANAAKAKGSRIICLGIGSGADEALLRLAASSSADYYFVESPAEVALVYDTLASTFCRNESAIVTVTTEGNIDTAEVGVPVHLNAYARYRGLTENVATGIAWEFVAGPEVPEINDDGLGTAEVVFAGEGTFLFQVTAFATDGNYTVEDVAYIVVRVGFECEVEGPEGLMAWFRGDGNPFEERSLSEALVKGDYEEGKVGYAYQTSADGELWEWEARDSFDPASRGSFTVEYWFLEESRRNGSAHIGWSDGTRSFYNSYDNRTTFRIYDSSGYNYKELKAVAPAVGGWHHIALTYDAVSSEARLYLDGYLSEIESMPGFVPVTSGEFTLGSAISAYDMDGLLDEVSFYSRVLSFAEVVSIHAAGSVGKCPVDENAPPLVDAGTNFSSPSTDAILHGLVSDDGLPKGLLESTWSLHSGPGEAAFADASSPETEVSFSAPGIYILKLEANDGLNISRDLVEVRAALDCSFEADDSLLAHWSGNATVLDSVAGRELEMRNGAGFGSGKVSLAFAFDGTDDSAVALGSETVNPASEGSFTVEYWFLEDNRRNGSAHLGWAGGTRSFYSSYDNRTTFRLYNSAGTEYRELKATAPATGSWHHVALTYDAVIGEARIYLNGNLSEVEALSGFIPFTTGALTLGQAVSAYPMDGMLDEVSMYSRALSFAEVLAIYDAGSAGKCPVDGNASPLADAGADFTSPTLDAALLGAVSDDGLPTGLLESVWSLYSGPGEAEFADASTPETTVSFSVPGIYILELEATDGLNVTRDRVEVRAALGCSFEPDASLLALWSGNGTALDSVSGRELEMRNGAGFGSGKVSLAFAFDGTDDSAVTLGSESVDPASGGSFTVEYWFFEDNRRNGSAHLGWAGGTRSFYSSYDSRTTFRLYNAAGSDYRELKAPAPATGAWHHVALTYDVAIGEARIYLNGNLAEVEALSSFIPVTTGVLTFGQAVSAYPMDGMLDEVSFYSRALSLPEVLAIYDADSAGKCPVDGNASPLAEAGADLSSAALTVALAGSVSDDGLPSGLLEAIWSLYSGPGEAEFADASLPETTVTFSEPGIYVLELMATDGLNVTRDRVEVRVGLDCSFEPDGSLLALWSGNATALDSVAGRELEMRNGAGFGSGKVSLAFAFDGTDDSAVALGSNAVDPASGGSFTVEYWFFEDNRRNGSAHLGWAGGTRSFYSSYDYRTTFRLYNAAGSDYRDLKAPAPASGGWHHLALTYESAVGEARLYLDGNLSDTKALSSFIPVTTGTLTLGQAVSTYPMDGMLDEVSLYSRALSAEEVASIHASDSIGKCPVVRNTPPRISVLDTLQIEIIETAQLNALITDDGLPEGNSGLSVVWSKKSGAGNVVFGDPTSPQTSASFDAVGDYVLEIAVSDSEYETLQTISVSVIDHINTAPSLNLGDLGAVQIGSQASVEVSVSDDGYPIGSDLSIEWIFLSGPEEVGLDPTQEVLAELDGSPWSSAEAGTAVFSVPGSYRYSVVVSDGISSRSETFTVEAYAYPEIELSSPSDGQVYDLSQDILFQANASVGGRAVASVEFFANGQSLGSVGPIENTITHRLSVSGNSLPLINNASEIYAVATDDEGRTVDSDAVTIQVLDTSASAPLAAFVDGQSEVIWESPAPILGTASSDILDHYELLIRGEGDESWKSLFVGTSSITDGALATFDPTLLLNGIYDLRLETTDLLGRVAIDEMTIVVDGGMKVGALSLAFEDLGIPVTGIPIQVVRSYDSRDLSKGDFGTGWRLALNSMRIQKNRPVGKNWMATQEVVTVPFFGETIRYHIKAARNNLVLLRLPDDSIEVFKAVANPAFKDHIPLRNPKIVYEPMGDTLGTLEILGEDNEVWIDTFGGETDLQSEAFAFDVFDPTLFKYTTVDGAEFIIDEDLGLQSVTDRNGNTLTIDDGGVTHSSGKSVVFARDAEGRIETITDPENQQLVYSYDAEGRLSTFTNRAEETFTFLYENPDFPNYLTDILDPEDRSVLSSEFDAEGRLIGQTDANGESYDFVHDIENFTETVVDRRGVTTVHTYDLDGDVVQSQVFDPDGTLVQTTAYEYDDRGNETKVTDSLGNVTDRSYDDRDNLLSETQYLTGGDGSILEATTSYTYDSFGNPLSITDAMEQGTFFEYDASGNLTSQTDALDNVTAFAYDASGNLESITDPLGNRTVFETSDEGFQTSSAVFDAEGLLMQYQTFDYDALGQQTHVYDYSIPEGATETAAAVLYRYTVTGYDGEGRVTSSRTYDAADTLLTQSDTTYDPRGQVESQTDALGQTTLFEYDDNGNRIATAIFSPDELELRRESWTYDAEGNQTRYTDPLGRVTTYEYDSLGRQTDVYFIGLVDENGDDLDASDNTSTHTLYDEIGRVVATVDERENATLYEYDENCGCSGRRTTVTNAANETTRFAYDLNGNQTSVTDAKGHTTTFEYDALNRPVKTIFHDDTFTETIYDALGRRVATIDQNGLRTDFVYDALGRLIEVRQPSPSPGEPRPSTRYRYDSFGNQIEQIDALDRSTKYEYDELGRRVKRILPELQEESYQYDALGNLIAKTDFNGYTTTFEYDPLYRLASEIADSQHPSLALTNAPAEIEYGYDAAGNRTSSSVVNAFGDTIHATSLDYDTRGRLTSRSASAGSLAYTYDSAGNLATTSSSNAGGIQNRYTYDDLNRLESVNDERIALPDSLTNYGYDAVGNLETVGYGNGMSHNYLYDTLNRLTDLEILRPDDSVVSSYVYLLGDAGNRQTVTEGSGRVTSYGYDDLYRLTSEQIASAPSGLNGTATYGYDAVGNRLSRSVLGSLDSVPAMEDQSFSYDANDRLESDSHDANGNTTESSPLNPQSGIAEDVNDTYDFRNRLITRTFTDGSVVNISYDADGNRVSKIVLDAQNTELRNTAYLVDVNNHTGYSQVVEEWENAGAGFELEVSYLYGHDLVSQTRIEADPDTGDPTPVTHFYLYDGHGTVRGLADATGALTDEYEYDAFGVLLNQLGDTENSYLYTGEQYDADLGMYFLRARYLNAQTGRFHNMDTYEGRSGEPLTLHKYLYAHGNPVVRIDPSGNVSLIELSAASNIMAGLAGIQSTFGFGVIDQVQQGRNAGLASIGVSGAITVGAVVLPKVVTASFRVFKGALQRARYLRAYPGGLGGLQALRNRMGFSFVGLHGEIKGTLKGTGWQSNHINVAKAFPDIPFDDGLAIALPGIAPGKGGAAHNLFHRHLDDFLWEPMRRGRLRITEDIYFTEVWAALENAGVKGADPFYLATAALEQAKQFGYFVNKLPKPPQRNTTPIF